MSNKKFLIEQKKREKKELKKLKNSKLRKDCAKLA